MLRSQPGKCERGTGRWLGPRSASVGNPPQTRIPSVGGQASHIPEALDPARKPRCLQNCWDQGGWALTSSKAKKVRWSQRQMVLLALSSVEQPMEDQSPVDHGQEGQGT